MIKNFYLKDYLTFKDVSCNFGKGLIVFSGSSGSGKSILMNSILSLFGNSGSKARIGEVIIGDINIQYEQFLIEPKTEFHIKQTTASNVKYFLNSQSISKIMLKKFTSQFSKHLHLKDVSDFQNDKVIYFLDLLIELENDTFKILKNDFQSSYEELNLLQSKLSLILKDEQNLDELIELTKFKIQQIITIDPKVGELEELKDFKNTIANNEKVQDALEKAKPFLNNTHTISSLLVKMKIDNTNFDNTINEINNSIEQFMDRMESLKDDDIGNILTRIENLSKLEKKYGSLEAAARYKDEQLKKLEEYDNITFEKIILEKKIKKIDLKITEQSKKISSLRKQTLPKLQELISEYLDHLHLNGLSVVINEKELDNTGIDEVKLFLNNTSLKNVSSGEFNRLRLAFLTAKSKYEIESGGILFLDEIDANLSGKESESIAKVLKDLAKIYQIFAISHQPQLSATANSHYLVSKENGVSNVVLLNYDQRIKEISRMISGENITLEATKFATKLLESEL